MRRTVTLLVVIALLVPAIFVAWHRIILRLPDSGRSVRAGFLPAAILEQVQRPSSLATLLELRRGDGDGGRVVTTAWLRVPHDLDPDYEVLLTYVGHTAGRKILDLIPERRDMVLMAMQYAAAYENDTWREQLALPRTISEAIRETVEGGMLAVSELEHRGFDRRRLTVIGVSVGSFVAVLHGAYDEAVPRVLVVHGGGDLRRILFSMYSQRDRPWTGRLAGWLAWLFLDPLDSLRHVERIAPRPFTMIASRGDTYFPEESARQLYDRARAPKAISWTSGDHVRSKRPDIVSDLVEQIDAYLDGKLAFDESENADGVNSLGR